MRRMLLLLGILGLLIVTIAFAVMTCALNYSPQSPHWIDLVLAWPRIEPMGLAFVLKPVAAIAALLEILSALGAPIRYDWSRRASV